MEWSRKAHSRDGHLHTCFKPRMCARQTGEWEWPPGRQGGARPRDRRDQRPCLWLVRLAGSRRRRKSAAHRSRASEPRSPLLPSSLPPPRAPRRPEPAPGGSLQLVEAQQDKEGRPHPARAQEGPPLPVCCVHRASVRRRHRCHRCGRGPSPPCLPPSRAGGRTSQFSRPPLPSPSTQSPQPPSLTACAGGRNPTPPSLTHAYTSHPLVVVAVHHGGKQAAPKVADHVGDGGALCGGG